MFQQQSFLDDKPLHCCEELHSQFIQFFSLKSRAKFQSTWTLKKSSFPYSGNHDLDDLHEVSQET